MSAAPRSISLNDHFTELGLVFQVYWFVKKRKIVFFPSMHFSECLSECLSFYPSGDWGRRILYVQDQFRLQNKKTSSRLAWLGNKMLFQKKSSFQLFINFSYNYAQFFGSNNRRNKVQLVKMKDSRKFGHFMNDNIFLRCLFINNQNQLLYKAMF